MASNARIAIDLSQISLHKHRNYRLCSFYILFQSLSHSFSHSSFHIFDSLLLVSVVGVRCSPHSSTPCAIYFKLFPISSIFSYQIYLFPFISPLPFLHIYYVRYFIYLLCISVSFFDSFPPFFVAFAILPDNAHTNFSLGNAELSISQSIRKNYFRSECSVWTEEIMYVNLKWQFVSLGVLRIISWVN